jgi:putative heme-binding domain-containing protein
MPILENLVRESSRPECRAQALCTLDGLKALTPNLVRSALDDPHPGVRRQAVRLSESWLGTEQALEADLFKRVDDRDPSVRFQLALSLGESDDHRASLALGRLAGAHAADPWMRAAILSSATRRPEAILMDAITVDAGQGSRSTFVESLMATIAGSDRPDAMSRATEKLALFRGRVDESIRFAALAALLEEGERAGKTLPAPETIRPDLMAARALARDNDAPTPERVAAIRLLGFVPADLVENIALLGNLLDPTVPAEVQRAAIDRLGRLRDDRAAGPIVANWKWLGPGLRVAALDALLARPAGTRALVEALERGAIAPGGIDAAHRQRLASLRDEALRARAEKVLAAPSSKGRQAVLDAYRPSLARPGDPERGKVVFGKVCAACHKLGGQGHEVGPDLAALTDTSPEALLIALFDPNREVDARYASYTAALKDGRVVNGLVAAETGNAVSLKRAEGQTDVILRADLDELTTSGQSLMPEGMENDVKPADLADLFAFVTVGAARPKAVAGNHPGRVGQAGDGTIRLAAASAAIFGPTLTFEPEYGNLGLWQGADDRASWSFEVSRPGTFTVSMEWACADESSGNPFLVRAGDRTLRGTVGGTGAGTWSRYRTIFVGELALTAGVHRLEFRPAGPVRGALLDLRAVVLTPRSRMEDGR